MALYAVCWLILPEQGSRSSLAEAVPSGRGGARARTEAAVLVVAVLVSASWVFNRSRDDIALAAAVAVIAVLILRRRRGADTGGARSPLSGSGLDDEVPGAPVTGVRTDTRSLPVERVRRGSIACSGRPISRNPMPRRPRRVRINRGVGGVPGH